MDNGMTTSPKRSRAIGSYDGWLGRFPRQAVAIMCMVFIALTVGCPNVPVGQPSTGNGNDEEPPDVVITSKMITPSTGFGLSALEEPISLFYSVDESATDVRGFRVPVADGVLNSAPIGERVITATNLAVGANQVLSFDPGEAGIGFFRVGILFKIDGVEEDAESQAVIRVQGSPDPIFIQPGIALSLVDRGDNVFISFDVRDPEGDVQWRLFYLSETDSLNVPQDQLGTAIGTGSGNGGSFTFPTSSLEPGDYQLGISATDSGSSIAVTVANGQSARIVTIPNLTTTAPILRVTGASVPMPPTIEVTEPATTVTIATGESFTILFTGTILEPGATGTIEVFFDLDKNVSNGFVETIAVVPAETTSVMFPTNALPPPGTYFIGALIFDGVNPEVTDYASGSIIVAP